MRRILTLILTINLCFIALAPLGTEAQSDKSKGSIRKNEGAIRGQYIVVFKSDTDRNKIAKLASDMARFHGGSLLYTYEHAVKGFSVEMSEAAAHALSNNPNVEYIEEDAEVSAASIQNNAEWGLDRIDQRDLPTNSTYSYSNTGAGVNVYVIDSGIRITHQEFSGRASVGYDAVGDGQNGNDCYGHGTHVAGIIGGATYGVAKGARLLAVRVLDCLGRGSLSRVIAGVDWVTANHVKPAVANLSFISTTASDSLDTAVRNSIDAGVTYVVSAGNNNIDAGTRSPSRVKEAITVAATDAADNRAVFSNYGAVVDVFAPGVDILSAWVTDDLSSNLKSGTSSAAPFVVGVAARYLGRNPGDAPDAVSEAITSTALTGKVINAGTDSPNNLLYQALTINDDFNDNALDATNWTVGPSDGTTIIEQNQRLEITPPASTTAYNGYFSTSKIDFTGSRTGVEVVQPTIQSYGAETFFALADGNNHVLIAAGGGNLVFQHTINGVRSRTIIPFDPAQHRFWRLRHRRLTDTILWETSADGVKWIVQRTVSREFSITALQVQLIAGKYTATTQAGTAVFDNLTLEPNPVSIIPFSDDFNDNALDATQWVVGFPTSSVMVLEQNNRLEMSLQPNTAAYNSVVMASGFSFVDKMVETRVVQVTSQGGWTETYIRLELDSNNYYQMVAGAGSFVCDAYTAGVRDRTVVPFSATNHRYWRFRHDSEAKTVNFETSANNATWVTHKTVNTTFSLNMMKLGLRAGAWGTGNATPGTAIFDDVRIERLRTSFPQTDNFNDNTRAAKWTVGAPNGTTIIEQNQRLEITPPASTTAYDGYFATNTTDLTDSYAMVEVVQPTIQSYGAETYLSLADGNNQMLIDAGGGNLVLQYSINGAKSRTVMPFNHAQHRFWRIRHNFAADTIAFETSPDGATWTTQRTVPRPFSITALQVRLIAGKYTATTQAGTAIFDNLRLARNPDWVISQ